MIAEVLFLFPKPTGPYAIGTISYYFKDEHRKEMHVEKAIDKRELMLQFWYPALGEKQVSSMPYPVEACAEMLNIERNIPFDKLECLKSIRTYSGQNVPPAKTRPYPVLLFSPGFTCPRTNNTAMCEDLASHGYVVVGIDPAYAASLVRFPDGRVIKHQDINVLEQDSDESEQQVWIDDAQSVLDQLKRLNKDAAFPLRGMFDLEKIGMFGHSYGGSTAAHLCRVDTRCKCGVSLDGGLFGKNPTGPFDKPFMFILAQEWPWARITLEELAQAHVTAMQYDNVKKKWLEYIPQLCDAIGGDAYQVVIRNTMHNDFSDSTLIKEMPLMRSYKLDVGSINGYRMTEIVNNYLVAFFNTYLKGEASPLLKRETSPYSEVDVKAKLIK